MGGDKFFIKLRAFITGPIKVSGEASTGFTGKGPLIMILDYLKDYRSLANYVEEIVNEQLTSYDKSFFQRLTIVNNLADALHSL